MDYLDILLDIRKLVRTVDLESKRIQKDLGVSIPQLLCLTFLSRCEGYRSTHRELTRHLHLNSSTVTGIVNRLEKQGLVARLPKQNDRRTTYVALTSAGFALLERSPELLHERLNKKLSALPEDRVNALRESLALLIAALGIAPGEEAAAPDDMAL